MSPQPTLGSFLQAFFENHLCCQQGVQPTTVRSYRDAIKLFLQFIAAEQRCKLTRLELADLTCDQVLLFLNHLEKERGNAVASRNQRLAALRNFFDYLADRVPERLAEAQRIAAIAVKRTPPPRTHFLQRDEIEVLFQNLPSDEPWALRDRTLLLFLYNTGARVQEVAELRVGNLELDSKPRVHLHGKGDKWRICPLWQQSAALLRELVAKVRDHPDAPVFVSRTGQALTRFGIYKIVRRHTGPGSGIEHSSSISPHAFRHAAAVHLLESGVEINVIRAWLGHVSLETTNRYAEITLRMKAQALEACEPPTNASVARPRSPIWRDDQSLLDWLKSL